MIRRRGTVILETEKGILLTAMGRGGYLLPGGGANKGETRFVAAIRELEEETGLKAYYSKVLFNYNSLSHAHTVVLIKAKGTPKPMNEIKKIDYYVPGKKIKLSGATKKIIDLYYKQKNE